jgi:hypothetical protein
MLKRSVDMTIEDARLLYSQGGKAREIALSTYTEKEMGCKETVYEEYQKMVVREELKEK